MTGSISEGYRRLSCRLTALVRLMRELPGDDGRGHPGWHSEGGGEEPALCSATLLAKTTTTMTPRAVERRRETRLRGGVSGDSEARHGRTDEAA